MAEGNVKIVKEENKVIKSYSKKFEEIFLDEIQNMENIKEIGYEHFPRPIEINLEDRKVELPYRGDNFEIVFSRKGYDKQLIGETFEFMLNEAKYFRNLKPEELSLKKDTKNPYFEIREFIERKYFGRNTSEYLENLINEENTSVTYTKYDPEASNMLKMNGNIYSTDFRFMRPSEDIFLPVYFALHLDTPKTISKIEDSGKIRDKFLNFSEDYAGKYATLRNIIEVLLYHGNGLVNQPEENLDEKGRIFLDRVNKIPQIVKDEDYKGKL